MKLVNKKIKAALPLLVLNAFAFAQNSAIFKGGNGDGWATGGYTQASVNIFKGGNGDGWASRYNPMGPLQPVLVNFKAQKLDNDATLVQWTASSGSNADYFEVERSSDAINFAFIGKMGARKNLPADSNNLFTDNQPLKGLNYYRLKQVDADGNVFYTPVRTVKFDEENAGSVKCYPNPTNGILNIEITREMQQDAVVINISNSTGIMVDQIGRPSNASTVFTIDLNRFTKGVYFIQVKTNTASSTRQIVLQ